MHQRHPRAATAPPTVDQAESHQAPQQAPTGRLTKPLNRAAAPRSTVLWASRAFKVRQGRLVAIRQSQHTQQAGQGRDGIQALEVALLRDGSTAITWLPASELLTDAQASAWLRQSEFRPDAARAW